MDSSEAEEKRNRISKAQTNLGEYYTEIYESIEKHNDVEKYNEDDNSWKGTKADTFNQYSTGYLDTLYKDYLDRLDKLINALQEERDGYERKVRGLED